MNFPPDQIEELKNLGGLQVDEEAGVAYILISQLQMPPGCAPARVDALLCPTESSGYKSRLYLAEQVRPPPGVQQPPNWTGQVWLLERNWHVFSRQTESGLRLAQMVCEHLRGFR